MHAHHHGAGQTGTVGVLQRTEQLARRRHVPRPVLEPEAPVNDQQRIEPGIRHRLVTPLRVDEVHQRLAGQIAAQVLAEDRDGAD
jgi:hypothetical protein